jgi:hypothetical protein
MSNQLQLHVNRIDLPADVLENVKSFLFYDVATYKAIKTHKYLNRFIVRDIQQAISRKGCTNKSLMTDTSPKWVFVSSDIHKTLIMYATNCLSCGNYVQSNTLYISHNAICLCAEFVIVNL